MPDIKNDTIRNIAIIILGFVTLLIKGQVVSLEEGLYLKPSQYTYEKDTNGSLNKFEGIWKGSFQGNVYELKLNKGIRYFEYQGSEKKRDRLLGRLRVRDAKSSIIYNTFDEPNDNETGLRGYSFKKKEPQWYHFHFGGDAPEGCINSGFVYIKVDPNNPNRMIAKYYTHRDILKGLCPPTFRATFPKSEEEFVLMRQ
ncbi:DUF6705 family protein [Bergeyella zoohelcum]|uniref:DUF6705 domain-containing protein n=1 Tax=Bergeyella zoohelcum ATCC 43767 TaxID=883096 RepID=K1LWL1_9FLAO|nr:DUF6705 family protein [Bergeyella zoohelcum]EKB59366.1 hypothetical protein HMPREF9699_00302 [Bergeyella zoohelcum ATCC 43767]SUV49522.1 Uncharacterised protein [Bergeyella zoohelcum]